MNYQKKYFKYKNKYLNLKKNINNKHNIGGASIIPLERTNTLDTIERSPSLEAYLQKYNNCWAYAFVSSLLVTLRYMGLYNLPCTSGKKLDLSLDQLDLNDHQLILDYLHQVYPDNINSGGNYMLLNDFLTKHKEWNIGIYTVAPRGNECRIVQNKNSRETIGKNCLDIIIEELNKPGRSIILNVNFTCEDMNTFMNFTASSKELSFLNENDYGEFNQYAICSKTNNHSLTIVKMGIIDEEEYFIVKNSWGPTWGHNGFFRIKKSSFPIIFKDNNHYHFSILYPKGPSKYEEKKSMIETKVKELQLDDEYNKDLKEVDDIINQLKDIHRTIGESGEPEYQSIINDHLDKWESKINLRK